MKLKYLILFSLSGLVVALDQLTKPTEQVWRSAQGLSKAGTKIEASLLKVTVHSAKSRGHLPDDDRQPRHRMPEDDCPQ